MADAVSELFEAKNLEVKVIDLEKEEELFDAEQKRLEAEAKARAEAEAEAARKAKEEAERKAKEEAERKAREEANKLIEGNSICVNLQQMKEVFERNNMAVVELGDKFLLFKVEQF